MPRECGVIRGRLRGEMPRECGVMKGEMKGEMPREYGVMTIPFRLERNTREMRIRAWGFERGEAAIQ